MLVRPNSVNSDYIKLYSLKNKKIGIPIFQRFYAWKEPQVEQLLEDIESCFYNDESHLYLLDFIYYEEDEKIKLADGQQRIVTINNLIKAIKDIANEKRINIDDIDLFDISYDIVEHNLQYKTHFDSYPTGKFKKVYTAMHKFVSKYEDRINDIIHIIKNRMFVHLKSSANADDAFLIFQQINTGGKPLTKDEIIKTAIDQYSVIYDIKIDTKKIKNLRQAIGSFYRYKTDDANSNFDSIAIISFIKEHITKNKSTFKTFASIVNQLHYLDSNPMKYVITYITRTTLLDVLNILAMKEIDVMKNRVYLDNIVMPLCLASVVLTMKGGSPTSYRYLLNNVINKIKKDVQPDKISKSLAEYFNDDPTTWKISFNDFSKGLSRLDILRGIKKALLIMDVIVHNTSGIPNIDSINLEHIYPQSPDDDWAIIGGWPTSRESRKELVDNIGNYLLLAEAVNKKIKNKYITYKISEYERIIKKDKILQTEANEVDLVKFEKKKGEYIKERQEKIANILKEDLPFGNVLILD